MNATCAIKDIDPKAHNLEGYLFPDTYFVDHNSTAEGTIELMVKRFRQVWQEEFMATALQTHQSVHDTVTRASILETEAKLPAELPIISSVIVTVFSTKCR